MKQLEFLEQSRIFTCWPDATSVTQSISGFFERLQEVREINKKNIQKRAYYDLLKYLKDQGMRSNFKEDLQPLLMKAPIQDDQKSYFYKAY